MEFNKTERLAIAQALYKVCGELVDTKNPDSLRGECDRFYKLQYEQTGSKSFDVKIHDDVVGTYSIRFSKEEPQEVRQQLTIKDYVALAKWFDSLPDDEVKHYVSKDLQPFAEYWLAETGEMPEGCSMDEIVILAKPKQYIGGVLKIDPTRVKDAVGNALPQGIAGLLE